MIEPTVNDRPTPKPMRLDNVEFPPMQRLYPTAQAAHDAMLSEIEDVMAELKSDGEPIPEFKEFYKLVRQLWTIWIHYAPSR